MIGKACSIIGNDLLIFPWRYRENPQNLSAMVASYELRIEPHTF
jgi:hypothetical protein